ncbi:hypothetical protein MRB53_042300 [Persea americana]|nr:hypothetical protein MRB53_042300 [Persea americana]
MRTRFGDTPAISSNVDDVTNHELYLWPFADAIRANAASVMASYNRINGTYASENHAALTEILKGELAFEGFVVSDWGAQQSGAPSAAAGLDMAMPQSKAFWQGQMENFISSGNLTQARFDDMVARTLTAWYKVIGGPDADFPEAAIGMPAELTQPHPLIDGRDPASKPTILQGAIEGHVLVKNTNNALPLNKPKLLSLFGFDATIPQKYYPTPGAAVDFIFNYGLESSGLNFSQVVALLAGGAANDPNLIPPESAIGGEAWNGGGSGANNPSALSETYGAIQIRARRDDTQLYWDFKNETLAVHPLSSACLVFINDVASEIIDRKTLASYGADQIVLNVASQCTNTIVVIHNPSYRTVDAWIDNDNVTAVIYAHYPGQDLGESLAQILYGEVSPSGRLPYTVGKQQSDYGSLENPCVEGSVDNAYCDFSEGIYIDYRYFQKNNITPRYAFGYGLTYSTFSYSSFDVYYVNGADLSKTPPNPSTTAPGGIVSLYDVIAQGSVTLTNTGKVAAAEVAQLYVHFPGEADQVHFLRGFDKVFLQPGETQTAYFDLTRRDLSRWNTVTQQWELTDGAELRVGPNAGQILYTASLEDCD